LRIISTAIQNPSAYVIVCSPLKRAQQTLTGLLPTEVHGLAVETLDCLIEARPHEYLITSSLIARQEEFMAWTQSLPTSVHTVIVAGHNHYYRKLLGMKSSFIRNCDVWQATLNYRSNRMASRYPVARDNFSWSDIKLLHRTELADPHPFELLSSGAVQHTEDSDSDEPTCRICQVTRSDN